MAGSIFESFQQGFTGGQQQARERRRQLAQAMAGKAFAAGNTKAGTQALVSEGMYAEAGAMGELGDRQRQDDIRTQLQGALTTLGPEASATDRLKAQRGVFEQAGEVDRVNDLDARLGELDEQQKQQAGEFADWLGSQALGLIDSNVPVEQRKARALQLLDASPWKSSPQARQMIEAQGAWDDATLQSSAQSALGVAERLGARERKQALEYQRERDKVGDTQWQQEFEAGERRFRISEANANRRAAADGRMGVGQQVGVAEQLRDNFDRNVKPVAEVLQQTGMVDTLQQKMQSGESLSGTEKNGLLFMIARMMQGGGILTDQDVGWMKAQNLAETTEAGVNYVIGDGSKVSNALVARLMDIAVSGRERARATAQRGIDETMSRAQNIGIESGYVFGGDPYDLYGIKRAAPAASAGPRPGTITNGYRFKGGNPNDRANWEPANIGSSGVPAQGTGLQPFRPGSRS